MYDVLKIIGRAYCSPYILSHRCHSSREIDSDRLMYLEISMDGRIWDSPPQVKCYVVSQLA